MLTRLALPVVRYWTEGLRKGWRHFRNGATGGDFTSLKACSKTTRLQYYLLMLSPSPAAYAYAAGGTGAGVGVVGAGDMAWRLRGTVSLTPGGPLAKRFLLVTCYIASALCVPWAFPSMLPTAARHVLFSSTFARRLAHLPAAAFCLPPPCALFVLRKGMNIDPCRCRRDPVGAQLRY